MGKYDEEIKKILFRALGNIAQAFCDDYVKKNAEFRIGAGLKAKIIRRINGETCDWCRALAGIYEYGTEPAEVYQRHDNCDCTVEYVTEKGTQNVHTKQWTTPEERAKIETRKTVGLGATNPDIQALRKNIGLQKTGADRGALTSRNDPDFSKREAHARKYYESIRHSQKRYIVDSISQNTGIDANIVDQAIEHLFYSKHNLAKGYTYFDSDYDIAESIRRLREGKDIQAHDLILLQHEALEASVMSSMGANYDEAHALAELEYNYKAALIKFLKERGLE